MRSFLFTSESVSEGHPDKLCDRISDEILDLYLGADSAARVAVETLVTTNRIVLAGEVRSKKEIAVSQIEDTARKAVRAVGYEQKTFHWEKAHIQVYFNEQSPDIARGVDASGNKDEGAGDQGLMFGYACRETEELMPAPICFAHRILSFLAHARHNGDLPKLGPDAKSQVTLRYKKGRPVGVASLVVSTQHAPGVLQDDVREWITPYVEKALPEGWMPPPKIVLCESYGVF